MNMSIYIAVLSIFGVIIVGIYISKYRGLPIDVWKPGAAWTRALIYFVICNIFSALTGTLGTLLNQSIVIAEQLADYKWIALCIFCFIYIFFAYWILWARMTLTFDRKYYIGSEIFFGLLWGISMGQLLLSFYHLWNMTGIPGWGVYVFSFISMGAWQYFIQDYFWDVYVSPEHDTPKSIKLKTIVSHIPNVAICLGFLVIYENYLIYVALQTFALIATTIFQKFPAPWAKGHFHAPMTKPGLLGFPHGAGYSGKIDKAITKSIAVNCSKYSLNEAQYLEALEHLLGKPLPQVDTIFSDTFGAKIDSEKVTGVGLFNCGLMTLPPPILELKSLHQLGLRANKLTTLPEQILQLKSLQYLNLRDNQLRVLPEQILQLKSLQYLNLRYNQLIRLPESFGQLQSLQYLNLRGNQLSTLPEAIGQLTSLQNLQLKSNQLTTLPESITQLKSLKTLNLWKNQLTTLPESFGKLKSLQELSLNKNQLTNLPESFQQLQSLQALYLGGNQLTTLPEPILQLNLLQYLYLEGNQLTTLPESFGNLKSLQGLYIPRNQLASLPESFGQLKSLRILNLSNNQLTTLPKSFADLESLQILDLSNNKFTILPESMLQLKSIQSADLSSNTLTNLLEASLYPSKLNSIYIKDNPLDSKAKLFLKKLEEKGVEIN